MKRFVNKTRKFLMKSNVYLKTTGSVKGDVLVSYLIKPFLRNYSHFSSKHTNEWECFAIVSIFLDSGYNVDIINYDNDKFVPRKNYCYFLDIHNNLARLQPFINKDCVKILHITGCHWLYQNNAEYARLFDIQNKRSYSLLPRRLSNPCQGIEICDHASMIGNDYTRNTFKFAQKSITCIHISATNLFEFNDTKDYEKCKRNYLWLGGSGMVLKGLDVVLEAFSELCGYNLFICGPINNETDFLELYHRELFSLSNIKTLGWVNIDSKEFIDLANNCIGIIYPSFSEGTAGSVVQCMHAGLIPVVSPQSGVDVENFGFLINENNVEGIKRIVGYINDISPLKLKRMSLLAWEYARKYHTRNRFKEEYSLFLKQIVKI